MRNFAFPFLSTDIAMLWRRWHISLTSWFRDYVYTLVDRGRSSKWRFVQNISVIYILSGVWHGARTATLWARYGQTTAMECAVGIGGDDIELLRNAIDKQLLPIDLYICAKNTATDTTVAAAKRVAVDYALARPASETERQESMVAAAVAAPGDGASRLLAARPDLNKRYVNRVRLGGIKFWLAPSSCTAPISAPIRSPS